MTEESKSIGLYIHVPFCAGKCPYCDFYSLRANENIFEEYKKAVIQSIYRWSNTLRRPVDTLYFGGGTPSLLGAERLSELVNAVFSSFGAPLNSRTDHPEITVECNPFHVGNGEFPYDFENLSHAGVNRISLGLQSAVDAERSALGRKGTVRDVLRAIQRARLSGISNISLDLMLGIPGQTMESLKRSINFCVHAGISHVSAYMLKIEEGTPFAAQKDRLLLPDEEEYCEFYLKTCEELEKAGFRQYEISNFAIKGFESRHNLKYWNCEEYLGIGPAAHSFMSGKRFYYERDLDSFLRLCEPVPDGEGGDFEEYAMLRLRLKEGLTEGETLDRFGFGIPAQMRERAKQFTGRMLLISDGKGIRLTPQGFLLSNTIIGELLK